MDTPTEQRVATLVGTGAANAAIGVELGISRRTVETHLRHVYRRCVTTRPPEIPSGAAVSSYQGIHAKLTKSTMFGGSAR